MICVVLAAGYATRLYPLTENFPKPLLEVGGRAILDHLMDAVTDSGAVEQFIIATNGKYAHHFEAWATAMTATQDLPVQVLSNGTMTNETRMGAVKDLQYAIDTLGLTGDLLAVAGDNILDFTLGPFIAYARAKGTTCVMRYSEDDREKCRKSGVLQVDGYDRVTSMEEKPTEPKSQWLCPPFYYFTQADAVRIPQAIADGCGTDAPGSYIAWLCERSPVHAMQMPGQRYDIGDIESLERVRREYVR